MNPLKYTLDLIDKVNQDLAMKESLQQSIRTIINQPEYSIPDSYYQFFLDVINGITVEPDSNELAVAYLSVVYYDLENFVVCHPTGTAARRVLVDVFLDIYRNMTDSKSDLLLLISSLKKFGVSETFANEVVASHKTTQLGKCIRNIYRGRFAELGDVPVDFLEGAEGMNVELKKFFTLILNPDSRYSQDNYVANRKITSEDLILTVGYLNGSGFISGIAFDRLIKIRFNYFENSCGFYATVDDEPTRLPLTKVNLFHFLSTGKFIPGTFLANGKEL